jgi:hypothetical protein
MHVFLEDAVNVFLSIFVCMCFVDARWLTVCHAWLQPEMIDWEVRGTLNVVEACANAAVKRLVLTSSLSAMVWDHQRTPGACIDEKCWSNLDFCRSKKVWQFYPGHPFHHHKILSRFSFFSAEGNLLDDQITLKLCKLSVFCQLNHESILPWSKNMRTRQSWIWLHLWTALLLSLLFLYIEISGRNYSWAPFVFNSCHVQMTISGVSNDVALEAQERAPKCWKAWLQNVSRMSRMLSMLKNLCWENCDIISETEACPSLL